MPRLLLVLVALVAFSPLAHAGDVKLAEHSLGKADAPIVVDEYASLTCSHCAHFAKDILPQLQAKYIDTGKLRLVFHSFVRDGVDLKASTLAYCMPPEQFHAFINVLFNSQMQWTTAANVEQTLIQYAKLGGLAEDKARACLEDKDLQNTLIAERTYATDKLGVQSTPTFIINNGAEKLEGSKPIGDFTALFDRLLAVKK